MVTVRVERTMPEITYASEPPATAPPDWTPDPEYAGCSDEDVAALYERLRAEHERRQVAAQAAATVESATLLYRAAAGISDGVRWRQPRGAHDAVPPGGTRVFEDGTLRRNVSGRPLAFHPSEFPGGWEIVAEDTEPTGPEPADYPAWEPDRDYAPGDAVAHEGAVYEVLQAHTSAAHWLPRDVPALYRRAD